MLIRRLIANRDTSVEPSRKYIAGAAVETRYAFSNKIEAMFASGIVRSLLTREASEEDKSIRSRYRLDAPELTDLLADVDRRYAGFDVPAAMDFVDPFLSHNQSSMLRGAIGWSINYAQREAARRSDDAFPSVVAGGLVLSKAIDGIEHPAYTAGITLLEHQEASWFARLRQPELPEVVTDYRIIPDTDREGAYAAQVEAELVVCP